MKKINLKILNISFWIEIILAYVLPFQIVDNSQYRVGFPLPFITAYEAKMDFNPLMSMYLNPLVLLFNVAVIYMIVFGCVKAYHKLKHPCA